MRFFFFLSAALFYCLPSFAVDVSFDLKNSSSKDTVQLLIEYTEVSTGNVRQLYAGNLLKNITEKTKVFSVSEFSDLIIFLIAPDGNSRKKLKSYKIKGKLKNEPFTVLNTHLIPEKEDLKWLKDTDTLLKYNPAIFLNEDKTPKRISSLFTQYLGGVLAYTESIENGKTVIKILDRIEPSELGLLMSYDGNGGAIYSEEQYYFKSNSSAKLSAKVPPIIDVSGSLSNDNLYQLKMIYKDCGIIDYETPKNSISLSDAFIKNVSKNKHYSLTKLRREHPTLKLKQIDKAYIIGSIYYELNEFKKSTTEAEVGISSFVAANASYTNESSALKKNIVGSSYLGWWVSNAAQDLTHLLDVSERQSIQELYKNVSLAANDEDARRTFLTTALKPDSIASVNKAAILSYLEKMYNGLNDTSSVGKLPPLLPFVKVKNTYFDSLSENDIQLLYKNLLNESPLLPAKPTSVETMKAALLRYEAIDSTKH
ncbi:MAG TPA: hypothetical protein VMR70_08405, partial [Flavisolibacter sp.]|nr:hypothetical protein [Flavisolibacter sp.]